MALNGVGAVGILEFKNWQVTVNRRNDYLGFDRDR